MATDREPTPVCEESAVETASSDAIAAAPKDEPLPKLSAQDFRVYNHMAEHMDMFHAHFRETWTLLHSAAAANALPRGLSARQFAATAARFCAQLELHHGIEEQHIFPVLARRMPAFRAELQLLTQHKAIHAGLDRLRALLADVRAGERALSLPEVREVLDSFGSTLWAHLDDEVAQLGAENMRRFWSLDEMREMPM